MEEAAHSNMMINEQALGQRKSKRLTRVSMFESLSIIASCERDSTPRSGL